MSYDEAEVVAWVPAILADAGLGKPEHIERERRGVANHVYRIDGRYVARFGTGSDGVQFPKSAAIMEAVIGQVATQELLHTDF